MFQQTKAKAEALKKPSQPKYKEGDKKALDGEEATLGASAGDDKPRPRLLKRKDKDEKTDRSKLSTQPSPVQQPVSVVNCRWTIYLL